MSECDIQWPSSCSRGPCQLNSRKFPRYQVLDRLVHGVLLTKNDGPLECILELLLHIVQDQVPGLLVCRWLDVVDLQRNWLLHELLRVAAFGFSLKTWQDGTHNTIAVLSWWFGVSAFHGFGVGLLLFSHPFWKVCRNHFTIGDPSMWFDDGPTILGFGSVCTCITDGFDVVCMLS